MCVLIHCRKTKSWNFTLHIHICPPIYFLSYKSVPFGFPQYTRLPSDDVAPPLKKNPPHSGPTPIAQYISVRSTVCHGLYRSLHWKRHTNTYIKSKLGSSLKSIWAMADSLVRRQFGIISTKQISTEVGRHLSRPSASSFVQTPQHIYIYVLHVEAPGQVRFALLLASAFAHHFAPCQQQ